MPLGHDCLFAIHRLDDFALPERTRATRRKKLLSKEFPAAISVTPVMSLSESMGLLDHVAPLHGGRVIPATPQQRIRKLLMFVTVRPVLFIVLLVTIASLILCLMQRSV